MLVICLYILIVLYNFLLYSLIDSYSAVNRCKSLRTNIRQPGSHKDQLFFFHLLRLDLESHVSSGKRKPAASCESCQRSMKTSASRPYVPKH